MPAMPVLNESEVELIRAVSVRPPVHARLNNVVQHAGLPVEVARILLVIELTLLFLRKCTCFITYFLENMYSLSFLGSSNRSMCYIVLYYTNRVVSGLELHVSIFSVEFPFTS